MTTQEWHTVIAFGLLTGGLALYDARLAMEMVGLAAIVILVRNGTSIEKRTATFLGDATI